MVQGDVDVQIVKANATAIDTAITAMRTTANDKWLMCSMANGLEVMVVNIEEV